MSARVELQHEDPVVAWAWRGPLIIVSIRGLLTSDVMDDIAEGAAAHRALNLAGVASIAIVNARTPIPDADARRRAAENSKRALLHTLAAATVIEGTGFWAATVRSVLVGINLVVRQPYPDQVFGSAQEAAAFVGPVVGITRAADLALLVDDVAALRAHHLAVPAKHP